MEATRRTSLIETIMNPVTKQPQEEVVLPDPPPEELTAITLRVGEQQNKRRGCR